MSRRNKRGQKSRKRDQYIYATTVGQVSSIKISIDSRDQSIQFENDMSDARSEVSYKREKAPKIVNRVFQDGPIIQFDSSKVLREQFEFVCSIDTNTKLINGRQISVTGVVVVQLVWIGTPAGLRGAWQCFSPFSIEYAEVHVKPEPFGWIKALEFLYGDGWFSDRDRVCAIVDSELGLLPKFNSGEIPLFGNRMLPKNVTLVYASSEASDDVTNKAISAADSVSTTIMDELESGRLAPVEIRTAGPFCDAMRLIYPKGEPSRAT